MSEPVLLERGPLSRLRLWQQTTQQARRTVVTAPSRTERAQIRLRSLKPMSDPIFVLGSPRSGTTYLGSLLASLPGATYFFEPQLFKYYVRLLHEDRVSERHAALVYRLGFHSLLLAAPGAGTRIVEKNPNHVFSAKQLATIFGNARFVTITRDGRDVAASLAAKPWHRADAADSGRREPGGYLYGPHPHFYIEAGRRHEFATTTDVHRCIWIWRRHQEEIERLRSAVTLDQHHLRYEDLVQQPARTLDRLLDYLHVPDHGRLDVLSESANGHAASVGRWQQTFDADELAIIEAEAGPLLTKLGYG